MFKDNLTVKGIKSMNPNVSDISNMLIGSKQTFLDLSEFDMTGVISAQGMFTDSTLTEVYVKTEADKTKLETMSEKPDACTISIKA